MNDAMPSEEVVTALQAWNRPREFQQNLFGPAAAAMLDERRQFDIEAAVPVICSFENRWGKAGGLFSVVDRLASGYGEIFSQALVISPLHVGLQTIPDNCPVEHVVVVPFEGCCRTVYVHKAQQNDAVWYLLRAAGFFAAEGGRSGSNPYLYFEDSQYPTSPRLLRDAAFFAKAVPQVVAGLGLTEKVLLHLHDWETFLVALTAKESLLAGDHNSLRSAAIVVTQHNPYDNPFTPEIWRELTDRPLPRLEALTVQNVVLRLVDAPPTMVSRRTARESTTDTLYTLYFAPHLQGVLGSGVVGVDNGPFLQPTALGVSDLAAAKGVARAEMFQRLSRFQSTCPPRTLQVIGQICADPGRSSLQHLGQGVPVFCMSGRLDQRQKGFCVLATAIEKYVASSPWGARFVLMPEPGDAPQAFIDQLVDVATRYLGRILVILGRMPFELYKAIQAGSSYSVWPSIYEPFGGVSEYLIAGTPIVARRTGGLLQQCRDLADDPLQGNGILYDTKPPATRKEWEQFLDADPAGRAASPCFNEHVTELCGALYRATEIFRDESRYRQLLGNLQGPLAGVCSWKRAIAEYRLVFRRATSP